MSDLPPVPPFEHVPMAMPLPPPAPGGRRSSSFWIAVLSVLLLLGSVALNVVLAVLLSGSMLTALHPATSAEGKPREKFLQGKESASDRVVVLPIRGVLMTGDGSPLGGGSVDIDLLISHLRGIGEDDDVKAVIFAIDSPGGSITDCERIVREMKKLRAKRPGLKIVSLFRDVAASGGYFIAAPTDEIIADPTTITGSIGVIMSFLNIGKFADEHGISEVVVKSAVHKDIGSMWRPMDAEEQKILQSMVNEMFERFIAVILDGRKGKITEAELRAIADGRIMSGEQALKEKLVDRLGDLDDAVAEAEKLAGISEARVVEYQRAPGLLDILRNELGASARSRSPELSIAEILHAETPRLMYLWKVK